MKRYGNLFEKICSMDNLVQAHQNAKKNKGWYKEVKMVDSNPEYYLGELQQMLLNHTYHTSKYEKFIKKEGSKEREIFKLPYFPDRICQWAIMQVIEPILLKHFTSDTYSAIPKRGTHKCMMNLVNAIQNDVPGTEECLKGDAEKFYPSISHDILKQKYRRLFKDDELLWLLDEIIDSISTCPATPENIEFFGNFIEINILTYEDGTKVIDGIGIPIGNYLSQYSGNFYLAEFDHWIKEVKHVKYYFRYMDDIVILSGSKEELHQLVREIDEFFRTRLHLRLKKNWQVFPTFVRGVDFVGYRTFLNYRLLRKSTCKVMKKKMTAIDKKRLSGKGMNYSEWCSVNSYKGWLIHCDSHRLSQKYVAPIQPFADSYYNQKIKKKGGKKV